MMFFINTSVFSLHSAGRTVTIDTSVVGMRRAETETSGAMK